MTALILLSVVVCAAPLPSKEKKDVSNPNANGIIVEDKDLVVDKPVDWTKTYSLAPYREFWTFDVDVKSYNQDLPKVIAFLEKSGAQATVPPPLMAHGSEPKSQQLSYKVPAKAGHDLLKGLGRLGAVSSPKITHSGEPVNLSEVKDKLGKLSAERGAHPSELAMMPSVAALADEMIQHLTAVKQVRESVDDMVMLNMTVREKR